MVSVTNDMTDLQVFVRASHRAMYSRVRVRAFSRLMQKLRSGRFEVKFAPTGLRGVLESCVAAVRPAVAAPSDVELFWGDGVPDTVRV
jgi:hypothetical protein